MDPSSAGHRPRRYASLLDDVLTKSNNPRRPPRVLRASVLVSFLIREAALSEVEGLGNLAGHFGVTSIRETTSSVMPRGTAQPDAGFVREWMPSFQRFGQFPSA